MWVHCAYFFCILGSPSDLLLLAQFKLHWASVERWLRSQKRWVIPHLASSIHRLVESSSSSQLHRDILVESSPRWVNRVSASHPRVVMVPHRVILAESSSPRRVLEWKSSRPRRVLKYRLKIRVSIYLFLNVGRKMTPFPETVSDPKKQWNVTIKWFSQWRQEIVKS